MRSPRVSPAQSVSTMRSFCLSTSLCSPMAHGNRNGSASLSCGLAAEHPQFTRWSSSAGHSATFLGSFQGTGRAGWGRVDLRSNTREGCCRRLRGSVCGASFSMGLRPRLSADAAFAARFEPRAGARGTISLRIVGAAADGREVAPPPSQLGWRKPLEPVAAFIERNMDRQDRQNRLILHPVQPVDPCKTRIEVRTMDGR